MTTANYLIDGHYIEIPVDFPSLTSWTEGREVTMYFH
jgi:hypothetical protein